MGGSSKGGGGYQPAQQPTILTDPVDGTTFMEYPIEAALGQKPAAQRLNEHIAERKAREATASSEAGDAARLKATNDRIAWDRQRDSAAATARNDIIRQIQMAGGDPNQYVTEIDATINRQLQSIPDLSPNPISAFPTSLGDTIINQALSQKRQAAGDSLTSLFTPDWSTQRLASSYADPFIENIVAGQFDPLAKQLENAQKRGTLTDTGYAAATKALGEKRAGATASVRSLGEGILGADRSAIDDYISNARNNAANLTLKDTWDPNVYSSEANRRVQSELGSFEGELRNATAGQSYASLSDLLNIGGSAQGPTNRPGDAANQNGAAGAPGLVEQALANQRKRGLGNTGAF